MKNIKLLLVILFVFIFNIKNTFAIQGIDVSEWQGNINFQKVKEAGIEIVYIRSSAGNSYVDANFEENYNNAKSAGLNIGFYHFMTARTVDEAKEQANFFAKVLAGKSINCKIAMDYEVFDGLSKEEINEISKVFLDTLYNLIKKELVIYSDAYNAIFTFDKELLDSYSLWVAEYGVEKPEVTNYIGWQFTDQGNIEGISGNVDRDIFTDNIFLSDTTKIKEPDIQDKTKTIYYRVKYGDTLWGISHKFGVSLYSIIKENDIKRPNLIFPNEVFKIELSYDYINSTNGEYKTITVNKGNNLTNIAKNNKVLTSNIVSWNNIKNPNLIYPHDQLKIKPVNNDLLLKYVVRRGNTLDEIARIYKTSVYELTIINNIKNPNYITVGEILYIPTTYIYEKEN